MRVSVILCTYDEDMFDHFREAADSILNQSHDEVELIVVVDGNNTVCEMVEDIYEEVANVKIHCNERNSGLLKSRNTGVELATGNVVAFIDDDAVADEMWVERLVEGYEKEDAVSVGGRMVPNWICGKPKYLPQEFYWLVGVTHRGFAEGEGEVRNTFGSNISFRRDVFTDLGGFDPSIGGRLGDRNLQGGETELCARLRAEYGQGVWYVPGAIVEHKVFEYRTKLYWLSDRAFWQGYSKRVMESKILDNQYEEVEFLGQLVKTFVPSRVKRMKIQPSVESLSQLIMLFVFTGLVGLGYLYGMTRY